MKLMVSETVTHYHEIEMSDELDIEKVIDMANALKKRCDTGIEAIEVVLTAYENKYGDGFRFEISPNSGGTEFEEVNFEYMIEE